MLFIFLAMEDRAETASRRGHSMCRVGGINQRPKGTPFLGGRICALY